MNCETEKEKRLVLFVCSRTLLSLKDRWHAWHCFFLSSVDSPINDDKVNEVKAEVSVLENNANDRKKNDIADVRENYKFDVSLSFIYVLT